LIRRLHQIEKIKLETPNLTEEHAAKIANEIFGENNFLANDIGERWADEQRKTSK
jgi:hypothetical protein